MAIANPPGVLHVYVSDLEKTAAFYRDVVGLTLGLDGDGGPGTHYEAWWPGRDGIGWMYLGFFVEPGKVSHIGLGFDTDDLDAVHRRALEAGVDVYSDPAPSPYGGRRASYVDPDGNTVSVTQRD